ncbi:MAG: 16S rRNA (adenine(1518)-N(6)/adenine(1519)-N(6))-dimethyltransferase RsmA [Actinomycetota bacterium]|nr:16S rRNA (adenine(1518)-N(6)/adenine(1519)-N(6))-dimethyltransferase RsmA [Actinomycetota bacterium]MDG1489473.1 16S rRNA (adenine(1518)-N(6)/adenine(1519)-N(6))-dimethyltransferase RsmA [Actinomycetota bacterium]MDG2121683.1 16S rRNA (adenine(1518)-N(6)/adenine(1519)-N(6))-dimethyltransferase RsmA [Actinomycetota bacterium]
MAGVSIKVRLVSLAGDLLNLSIVDVKRLLEKAGIAPKKSLGQNFVVDPNTVKKIVRLAQIKSDSRVVEIGPGLGSLTLALIDTGAEVSVVETDGALIPLLTEVLNGGARIVHADARTVDWQDLAPGKGWDLVANLPYNIATSLVIELLDEVPSVDRMLVMVQREAGERIAAKVGDSAYGAVSVRVALRAKATVVGSVPPSVFYPKPRVASVLVAVERHKQMETSTEVTEEMIRLLRLSFGQRRKMLRKSLIEVTTSASFTISGVKPSQRPEELDVETWLRFAEANLQAGA